MMFETSLGAVIYTILQNPPKYHSNCKVQNRDFYTWTRFMEYCKGDMHSSILEESSKFDARK